MRRITPPTSNKITNTKSKQNNNIPKHGYKSVLKLTGPLAHIATSVLQGDLEKQNIACSRMTQLRNKSGSETSTVLLVLKCLPPRTVKIGPERKTTKIQKYNSKHRFCSKCQRWGHFTGACRYYTRCHSCVGIHLMQSKAQPE
ncbi:hypothetical protein CHS0354_033583, partial [Potamilus streckersoni]